MKRIFIMNIKVNWISGYNMDGRIEIFTKLIHWLEAISTFPIIKIEPFEVENIWIYENMWVLHSYLFENKEEKNLISFDNFFWQT